MRATTEPSAASRSAALTPSDSSRAGSPSCASAHRATCSAPTLRGRTRARESTATVCRSPSGCASPGAGGCAPRATSCATMRCALALDVRRHVVEQVGLPRERRLDALAERGPAFAVDVEVAAEVEQGALADAAAVAFGAHQAVGVVAGAVGLTGLGAADEHGGDVSGGRRRVQDPKFILWHYHLLRRSCSDQESMTYGTKSTENRRKKHIRPGNDPRIGKLGLGDHAVGRRCNSVPLATRWPRRLPASGTLCFA